MNWRYRDVLQEAKNGYMASLSLSEIKSDLIPHEEKVFHSVSEFWDRKLAIPKLTLDDSGVAQPGDFNTQFRQYLTVGMSGPGIIGFALNRYMSKLEKNVLRAMALTAPDTLIFRL
jgi:hypothetical protein